MKTYSPKAGEVSRNWYVVDAENMVLGRLATRVADVLRGKHKPRFAPHMDTGDFVIVVNAEKVRVTGNKEQQKTYFHYSGYMGGMKSCNLAEMRKRKPDEIIRLAVRGMLPKNRLNRKILGKLKIYTGPEHPHEAQQPKPLEIKTR